ncbi:hypothetical protein ACFUMJ_12715 [Streptomyces olivaceus]|uniref:hypothetical protein n=1 Tax=Streptomyces TaxID=1883 RepID=UPI001FB5DE5A|nr:hypothetical protein [Streptomyces sp. CB09030]UOG82831.1 hypothetical protein L6J92_28200 [Streptomyces sp. CB09030]
MTLSAESTAIVDQAQSPFLDGYDIVSIAEALRRSPHIRSVDDVSPGDKAVLALFTSCGFWHRSLGNRRRVSPGQHELGQPAGRFAGAVEISGHSREPCWHRMNHGSDRRHIRV